MGTAVSELFDRVLLLEDGEVITLTFKTEAELHSKRIMLFREKKKYEDRMRKVSAYKNIFISQEIKKKDNRYKLHLSTCGMNVDWLASAVVVKDGIESPMQFDNDKLQELAKERINRLESENEH